MIPNPSSAADVETRVGAARGPSNQPIGVGFLMPMLAMDALAAAAKAADVVEFFYGDPDPELVSVARAHGALAGWQAGSADEAAAAAAAGCDFVVIQGTEAGGHVRGTQQLDEVLEQTLTRIDIPAVAAGGIGTAGRVTELLAAGASAVRVGTRFVVASEADAHPVYVESLIAASGADTVLCEKFGVGWPAPHRVLRSAVEAAEALDGPVAGLLGGEEVPRFSPQPAVGGVTGDVAAMALYAGTSVDAVTAIQPAAAIVAELTAGL